ncbi:hypothetical protein ACQ4PT_036536 [Festuca glaucescens]
MVAWFPAAEAVAHYVGISLLAPCLLLVGEKLHLAAVLENPKLIAECQAADVVVLTYACNRLSIPERLNTYWLPELRRIQLKVHVIVVGCMLDLRDDQQNNLE